MLDDPNGGFRDPQVHYDGKKIVFSWRRDGADYYHLYEVNVDGTGLTQLTDGTWNDFDPAWLPAILGLTLFNYGLRFWKWDLLLRASGLRIPLASNARLYFACLAMVVTPARLGELYKLVFLRKLHGVAPARSLPPLVLERVTDAAADPKNGLGLRTPVDLVARVEREDLEAGAAMR